MRPTRSKSCGTRPFGTTTSWLNLSGVIILSDGEISRRTRHSSWRSRVVAGPQELGGAGVAARLFDAGGLAADGSAKPSTSISSSAAVPAGASDRTFR